VDEPARRRAGILARAALLALAAALVPACAPPTSVQKAGEDQEIVRDIGWELRGNPRFADVQVTCVDRVITLSGRVDTRADADAVCGTARSRGRGAPVVNRLTVRPR